MGQQQPLEGLRVIEIAGWNGVLAGRLLADGGADVVRVAPPEADFLQGEGPYLGDSGLSIQEAWYNAGKRSVAIDLATAGGREQLIELLRAADVLIEDWRPGHAPLESDEIEAANPRLARVSVLAMGEDGPWSGMVTNDLVQNALSGAASVTGDAETPPLTGYGNQSHHTVGLYAGIVALAAARSARLTGKSQHVTLSAHEALVSCTEQVLMQWWFPEGTWAGPVAKRQGSLHWSGAYEVYPAKDGKGVMVTAALNFANAVLPWLKEDGAAQELADEERYPNIVSMIRDLPYVMRVMKDWVATYEGDAMFYEAQRRHQPYGVVWDIAQAAASPQIAAREYVKPVEIPGFGEAPFPGRFFRTNADGEHPRPGTRVEIRDLGWERRPAPAVSDPKVHGHRPLEGVRVMDFTHVLAGPFGTRVLADLGAEVIKVGTGGRATGSNTPAHPYYMCWNRNKKSISINLASEDGRELARMLANRSDIITENFSAGVLKRWGLDRASLAASNPGISVIAMGGMGQTGPWSDFVTFAPTLHALTGLTYLTNPPGRHDLGYGFSLTDHLSGLTAAFAALEALEHRERTGEGLEIDVAQYEMALGIMAPAFIDYLANGTNPEPVGNRHPFGSWAPHGVYPARGEDRWVAVAVKGDAPWRSLCRLMERAELANDSRFATHEARLAHEDELDALIADWTRGQDRYEVMEACQAVGVAAGAVQDAEDLNLRDRQLAHREFFTTATCERWGEYGLERFPARFNGRRPGPYEAVHEVGEDTFEVMTGLLGLPDERVAELIATGVLA